MSHPKCRATANPHTLETTCACASSHRTDKHNRLGVIRTHLSLCLHYEAKKSATGRRTKISQKKTRPTHALVRTQTLWLGESSLLSLSSPLLSSAYLALLAVRLRRVAALAGCSVDCLRDARVAVTGVWSGLLDVLRAELRVARVGSIVSTSSLSSSES